MEYNSFCGWGSEVTDDVIYENWCKKHKFDIEIDWVFNTLWNMDAFSVVEDMFPNASIAPIFGKHGEYVVIYKDKKIAKRRFKNFDVGGIVFIEGVFNESDGYFYYD